MNWRGPILILVILLVAGAVITWLNVGRTGFDTVLVELERWVAPSIGARNIDEHVQRAVERRHFNQELKLRLAKREREILLSPIHMDECEVSQSDYEHFVDWMHLQANDIDQLAPDWLESVSTGHRSAGRQDSPASGVTYQGASRYCEAVGGRLPWVEELEAAARGKQARLYPWGNEFNSLAWPYAEPDRNAQQACGLHQYAGTPTGIQDLANNVMEWTMGTMNPELLEEPAHRPAFGSPPVRERSRELYALSAAWLPISTEVQSHHLGFRCVYDILPPPVLPWGTPAGNTIAVQGGDYTLGIPDEARITHFVNALPTESEIPLEQLVLSGKGSASSIRVDRCEVSRAEYQKFLNDPLVKLGLYGNDHEPVEHSYQPLDWEKQQEKLDLPVTGISWWAADAFARWSGGRLPTTEEWRAFAAGSEKRQFPWGDYYDPANAATGDDAAGRLTACSFETQDVTPEGIRHLAGNASEWTRSVTIDQGAVAMWVQGGNWMLPGEETTRTTFMRKVPLNHRTETIGIRVVYD